MNAEQAQLTWEYNECVIHLHFPQEDGAEAMELVKKLMAEAFARKLFGNRMDIGRPE